MVKFCFCFNCKMLDSKSQTQFSVEFNRLEERMLSAVSQQIQTIQEALKLHQEQDANKITTSKFDCSRYGIRQALILYVL